MCRITALIALMLLIPTKIKACEEPMILSFNGDWAPYIYKLDNDTYLGSDLDILTQTLALLSCDVKVLSMPIQRAYIETQKGVVDVLLGASFTSLRNVNFYFSNSYRQETVSFAVLETQKELLEAHSLERLLAQGKKVIINMDGYFGETVEVLKKRFPRQFVHEFRLSDRLRRVGAGDAEIMIDDKVVLCGIQKRYNSSSELVNFVVSDKVIRNDPVHFMFNRHTIEPEFIKSFNDALASVLEQQTTSLSEQC